jgi:4-alpha-glucanotransferase
MSSLGVGIGDNDTFTTIYRQHVEAALHRLGIRVLVFAFQEPSFPALPGADTGRGSPYSAAGLRLLRFVRALGFNAVQFGPQGETSWGNASPYDSTIFSRSTLSIALDRLVEEGLLRPQTLERIVRGRGEGAPMRTQHTYAVTAHRAALTEAAATFYRQASSAEREALARFREAHWSWLASDALYEALAETYGEEDFQRWPDRHVAQLFSATHALAPVQTLLAARAYAPRIDRYVCLQNLAHRQHASLRAACRRLGLTLYGDMAIGMSRRDVWRYRTLFLDGYALGAPPSRTNPCGQPWGYPVLDPGQYQDAGGRPGPVLRFVAARADKLLDEFDGVRIDHPHGLVCPWVYRTDISDAYMAVQTGARLFSSPHVPEHPTLARFAIAAAADLDPACARYADGWVHTLSAAQVERYALLFDEIVAAVQRHGASLNDLQAEVLSTLPYPLACVLARDGLGRYRVTQKANLDDPEDVYRAEHAEPADWVMLGNHDTPSIWQLVHTWEKTGRLTAQAAYLARRLAPQPSAVATLQHELLRSPERVALAKFADLFVSRARQVVVFFTDLFGYAEDYNVPGTVRADNWSLRLPADFERLYHERVAQGAALNIPAALALALEARGLAADESGARLAAALRALATAVGTVATVMPAA